MVIATILGLVGAVLFFPVYAGQTPTASIRFCRGNIKQLATATQIYLANSDDVFPPHVDPRLALRSHVRNLDIGQCPTTEDPYAYNARLRGLPLARVRKPEATVMFYEGRNEVLVAPHTPNVAFADGHVKTVAAGSTVQFAP
jgi:prepilin-type processing-associated H-X9-DG protein